MSESSCEIFVSSFVNSISQNFRYITIPLITGAARRPREKQGEWVKEFVSRFFPATLIGAMLQHSTAAGEAFLPSPDGAMRGFRHVLVPTCLVSALLIFFVLVITVAFYIS